MKRMLAVMTFTLSSMVVQAQSSADSAGVRKAVNDYVEGFYFGDTTKIYYSIDQNA